MAFRLVHAAGNMFAPQSKRLAIISEAARNADVLTLSEAIKDHNAIRALAAFDDYTVGELSIAWRPERLAFGSKGGRRVMAGGKLGTGRRGDRRRRGPGRDVRWVVLRDKVTGRRVILATHHAIARSDTKHKWRRPLRALGFRGVAAELNIVRARYPDAALILTGDLNTIGRVSFAVAGIREARTPATFGRLRYDRLLSAGPVKLTGIRRFATRSDHKALLATVTLGPATAPPPEPPKPPEVPVARQARSLDVFLAEVNAHAPKRSKVSDGGLGDPRHAKTTSDHNPNAAGVWRARDVTNDPVAGMPGQQLSRLVAAKLGKHPALGSGAYVIFNHQIISANRKAEGWRPYTGVNAHEHHVHVSVATAAAGYDSTVPWGLFRAAEPALNHVETAHELGIQLLIELRRTKKSRTSVHRMADEVEAALKKGPAS